MPDLDMLRSRDPASSAPTQDDPIDGTPLHPARGVPRAAAGHSLDADFVADGPERQALTAAWNDRACSR